MTWSHSNFVTPFPIYDFDLKKTKKLFFTNLHILGVRKTFEKLEKELIKAFENPKDEGKKEVTEAKKCPICIVEPPKCPPNRCPPLPKCPETTAAPPKPDDTGIPLDGDKPPPPYDQKDPNAPSGKHITYKRIYDFFTQAGFQAV